MRSRSYYLIVLLVISFAIRFFFDFFTIANREIKYAGNIVRVDQYGSNCRVQTEKFYALISGDCAFRKNQKIVIIGRVRLSMIAPLKGKKELVEAKIDTLNNEDSKTSVKLDSVSLLDGMRLKARQVYQNFLPQDEAGLVSGIVFGLKDDIGYDFYEAMIRSGTVHVAVASGFNLMLLYGFLSSVLFWFFERKVTSWILIVLLLFYSLISGMQPPIFRAWLMISFLICSQGLGRKVSGWWLLWLSVWLMLVWDSSLLTDVSFQLSAASSFALIVVLPEVKALFEQHEMGDVFVLMEKGQLMTTAMATVCTLPIIYWHFGRVGFWGLVSNTLVLPLVPPLMVFGLAMLFLPSIFYLPTYFLAKTVVFLIYFFAY